MPISYGPSASCRIRGWSKSLSQTLEIGNCISSTNSCSSVHWITSNLILCEGKACLWGHAEDFSTSYADSKLNNYVIMKYVWNMFGFFSLPNYSTGILSIYLFAYLLSWDAMHNTEKGYICGTNEFGFEILLDYFHVIIRMKHLWVPFSLSIPCLVALVKGQSIDVRI